MLRCFFLSITSEFCRNTNFLVSSTQNSFSCQYQNQRRYRKSLCRLAIQKLNSAYFKKETNLKSNQPFSRYWPFKLTRKGHFWTFYCFQFFQICWKQIYYIMFSEAIFNAESGYEINFCHKWRVQQCCQILIIRTCKNTVVGNPENF